MERKWEKATGLHDILKSEERWHSGFLNAGIEKATRKHDRPGMERESQSSRMFKLLTYLVFIPYNEIFLRTAPAASFKLPYIKWSLSRIANLVCNTHCPVTHVKKPVTSIALEKAFDRVPQIYLLCIATTVNARKIYALGQFSPPRSEDYNLKCGSVVSRSVSLLFHIKEGPSLHSSLLLSWAKLNETDYVFQVSRN